MKIERPMRKRRTQFGEVPERPRRVVDSEQRGEKLHKVLALAGLGSRRAMEEEIAAGKVTVNGEVATLGMRVNFDDKVAIGGRPVKMNFSEDVPRILIYHKPEGEIVSRDDPEERDTVFEKLPRLNGAKWIAVGRLDINSSGLLIFTTSGELANRLMHPRFEVEREYAVRVMGQLSEEQAQRLVTGVDLEDGPAKIETLDDRGGEGSNHWYGVVLREGRNREVRRLFEAIGLTVSRLLRVRYGILNMPPYLKRGQVLELGPAEVEKVLNWVGMNGENETWLRSNHPFNRRARPDRAAQGETQNRRRSPYRAR
jgi:23S rRNA pseudouridine2605 synthase